MIRLAEPHDAVAMMAIYNQAVHDEVHANADVLQDSVTGFADQYFYDDLGRYASWVTTSETSGVVGWGALKTFSARPRDPTMAEVAVYIARENRSAGLGIRLLRRMVEHARDVGFHSLVAIILGANRQSLRGCQYCGFKERVRLPLAVSLYGGREDVVWLQLVLSTS